MPDDRPPRSASQSWNQWFREWLATLVVLVSIIAVTILVAIALREPNTSARDLLTMVLPMIGTWVGTVLAFYFGREQLLAATQSVTAIASQLTPEEKLRSLRVTDKMIPRTEMHVARESAAPIKLLDAIAQLEASKRGSRLPVLGQNDEPVYVVHRSTIDGFIAKKAAAGTSADELKALTLTDLINDPQFGKFVQNTAAIVPETSTLADAKRSIDAIQNCQDAFVTRGGSKNEAVTGWVTNVVIESNSKL